MIFRTVSPSRKILATTLALCSFATGFVISPAAELQRDIEYGRAGGESLRLDASVPDGDGPFPIAILIHGGGWSGGDKSGRDPKNPGADVYPWFDALTAAKFTWFSINYRLAPEHRWPACFDDVETAILWVKAHAGEYKGDAKRIALFGHSAGGHLAFLVGVHGSEATRVQAVVGYAPVTDFEFELPMRHHQLSTSLQNLHGLSAEITPATLAILRETAPITQMHPGMPPFLILHGDADVTVPLQESRNFEERVRAVGGTCELMIIPGAPHRLNEWDKFSPGYADRMIAWLKRTLR
jgi:alpha-L-fucosidase 2